MRKRSMWRRFVAVLAVAALFIAATTAPLQAAGPEYFSAQTGPGGTWNVYQVYGTGKTWDDARVFSGGLAYGGFAGHLATIGNQAENDALHARAAGDYWIGLTDSDSTSTIDGATMLGTEAGTDPVNGWVWLTGEPFSYQNWGGGEPNDWVDPGNPGGPGEDAAHLRGDGMWNDNGEGATLGGRDAGFGFVVEYDTAYATQPVFPLPPPTPQTLLFHARLDDSFEATIGPSGNPTHGVGQDDPGFAEGKLGTGAVQLGGDPADQAVQFGDVGIAGATPRTISGWVNAGSDVQNGWASAFGFVDNGGGGDQHSGKFFDVTVDENGASGDRYRPHQWGSEQGLQIAGADTVDAGNWHHVAVSYDADGNIVGYMDGEKGSQHNRPGLNTTADFWVGMRDDEGRTGGSEGHYFGSVDDVAVWEGSLEAAEVKALFYVGNELGETASSANALFALFDSGAGSIVINEGNTPLTWSFVSDVSSYGGFAGDAFQAVDGSHILRLGDMAGLRGVPEPGTMALALCTLLTLGGAYALRRRRSA